MVLTLVLASCQAAPAEEKPVVEKEKAAVVEEKEEREPTKKTEREMAAVERGEVTKAGEPQYGGTLTFVWGAEPQTGADPYYYENNVNAIIHEELCHGDWATSGAGTGEWHWMGTYYPAEYFVGMLAESWEEPDPETLVFHIRKGVRWQNRPPVNSRELTAEDIAYSFSRWYGLGYAGFTKKSPHFASEQYQTIKSIEVPDKYTVVFRHTPPNAGFLADFLGPGSGDQIVARECVEQEGGYNEWMRLVGTSPWMIDDYVPDSSFMFVRNPDYWGYDELHPENRIPYADGIKVLIVPDYSTQLAALRAGKVVSLGMSWEVADQVAQTHPNIRQASYLSPAYCVMMRYGAEPFDDIRIRRALQMSVNLEELCETYYGGHADPVPLPTLINPGFYTPLDELPQEVQDGYTYNPEEARRLLAEAGYPDGFQTNIVIIASQTDVAVIIKDYFAGIGVDIEIKTLDTGAWYGRLFGGKLEQMTLWLTSGYGVPIGILGWLMPGRIWNVGQINDSHFNGLINDALAIVDYDEWGAKLREANDYAFSQVWCVTLPAPRAYIAWQPWLGGYNGEQSLGGYRHGDVWARIWIDQNMKREMGH
jgi:peptide/nickel transport system substrate-binding protein